MYLCMYTAHTHIHGPSAVVGLADSLWYMDSHILARVNTHVHKYANKSCKTTHKYMHTQIYKHIYTHLRDIIRAFHTTHKHMHAQIYEHFYVSGHKWCWTQWKLSGIQSCMVYNHVCKPLISNHLTVRFIKPTARNIGTARNMPLVPTAETLVCVCVCVCVCVWRWRNGG